MSDSFTTNSPAPESGSGPPRFVLLAPAISLHILILSFIAAYVVPVGFVIAILSLIACPIIGLAVLLFVFAMLFNGDIELRHPKVVVGVVLACLDILIPVALFALAYSFLASWHGSSIMF